MTMKNPINRLESHEVLQHTWFTKGCNSTSKLSSALMNMQKYSKEYVLKIKFCSRFNVEKIKPDFGLLTSHPVFPNQNITKDAVRMRIDSNFSVYFLLLKIFHSFLLVKKVLLL
jgi:hypothetical protein